MHVTERQEGCLMLSKSKLSLHVELYSSSPSLLCQYSQLLRNNWVWSLYEDIFELWATLAQTLFDQGCSTQSLGKACWGHSQIWSISDNYYMSNTILCFDHTVFVQVNNRLAFTFVCASGVFFKIVIVTFLSIYVIRTKIIDVYCCVPTSQRVIARTLKRVLIMCHNLATYKTQIIQPFHPRLCQGKRSDSQQWRGAYWLSM